MVRKVFRCAVGTRVFAWAVIAGGLVAAIGLAAMIVLGIGMLPITIVLLALAVFGMLYLWRFALHPKVVVDGHRLWVVNPMHTHILDSGEITDIGPGPNGLLVSHADGVVEAWAVQKGTRALRKGKRRRADRIAEELLLLLQVSPPAAELADEDVSTPLDDRNDDDVSTPLDDREDDEDLIIRRARPADLDSLVALEEQINTEALGHVFTNGEPFPIDSITDRWSRALGDRSFKVRVAEIDGEPVGYLCYDAEQVHQVGLLSHHSGRGHGRSLLEYATDDMAARGAESARLQVLEANEAALGFYRHLGWNETGDRKPCQYPPHPTELTLSRKLDDGTS